MEKLGWMIGGNIAMDRSSVPCSEGSFQRYGRLILTFIDHPGYFFSAAGKCPQLDMR